MKNYGRMDLGAIFDDVFEAVKDFSSSIQQNCDFGKNMGNHGSPFDGERPEFFRMWENWKDDTTDYYPAYSYPPTNVYFTKDKELVFEFAVAGFDEKDLTLSFQGDYMIFAATLADSYHDDDVKYLKRRLKMKDIPAQKYFAPEDKFDQTQAKAVYKNGILRVSIPPKEQTEQSAGFKIEIVKEGE